MQASKQANKTLELEVKKKKKRKEKKRKTWKINRDFIFQGTGH